ncbi:MAG TPA: PilT/PilU family type 4a pilus ATPase [Planctomycetota bacterium]|nr:PilT/PilU family type 4a pilus ATPase [Planctomycetota bacterium]
MNRSEFDAAFTAALQAFPGASDFNFTVNKKPQIEVNGELKNLEFGLFKSELTPEQTRQVVSIVTGELPAQSASLEKTGSCDCAYALPDGTRFRVNVFRSKGNCSVVLRVLASDVPSLESLKLPPLLDEVPKLKNGMVLVAGSTGSGKSTTLAAVIDRINSTRAVHVVTLEDPIEFSHRHKLGTINQREQGSDFETFSDGLRAALRQAPKVILVGEMRDAETMEIGIKAAETGHLVLSTLHTIDAGQTINRITGMFPLEERPLLRSRLAQVLRFVIGQRLLPKEGGGRVPALEIMGSSMRSRELVQNGESGDKNFYQVIADSKAQGWQTFDQHILQLFSEKKISLEVAKAYCSDLSTVTKELDRIRSGRGEDTSGLGELEMAYVRKLK